MDGLKMTNKKALITGITGQDGSYLAELLLSKGYEVHGLRRRVSLFNTQRIDHLLDRSNPLSKNFKLHYADMNDALSLSNIIFKVKPDELYNLAAQSHVAISFDQPEYTADCDGLGTLRLLEAIRQLGLIEKVKFYQASTSELYGKVLEVPQTEKTPFYPRSPYGVAKLYAYWITVNYRESYNMFACNGILFNHESERRGETFVSRKITMALSKIKLGLQDTLYLGNLDALRDWGHAKDYVEMQWMMLQQEKPVDYVIATGIQYSVRYFVEEAAKKLDMNIKWKGKGIEEIGYWDNKEIVKVDPIYFRPSEVETLLGDPSKAHRELDWSPKISFDEMVESMIENDYKEAKNQKLIQDHGN